MIWALSFTFLLLFPFSFAQSTSDFGPGLTKAALEIQGAISPACNTTDPCVQFVTDVVSQSIGFQIIVAKI